MKPGDLVEFKAGLFGIQPPHNLGIYLERVKRKGTFFVVLHTIRGKQEIKNDNITGRKLSARLAPDELEKGDLAPRLKQLIEEVTKGKVRDEARAAEGATDRDLWQKVKDVEGAPQTPEQLAGALLDTKTPTRSQVGELKKILESCREPGVGYFERVHGREELWRPITRAEHVSFHQEKDGLAKLRNKLILVEEVEDEDTGYLRTVYKGIPVGEANLDENDRARLAFVAEAMKDFVLHDRFTGRLTLGISGKHTLDGFSLFPWLKFLALDWTGSERVSISSTFIELLVDVDLLGLDDAVELVARRKVLQNPNFAWETAPDILRAGERSTHVVSTEGRVDLRATTCYTIDPPDARDHDDAVGVEWHANGDATLWVHIADVSHYVTPESTLDHDARKRATSVYLPTGVLPMLPPRLSNDLCSLEPQQDRYAMTVRIRYDADGKLVEEQAMESVIRVAENVPYPEALARMEADPDGEFARMRTLADKLDAHRRNLAIETSERRVRLTSDNVDHVEKMGTPATRLIETFMVAANEAIARILTREKVPLLYRCHPLPDRASIERFNAQCATMEVPIRIVPPDPPEKPEAKQEMSLLDALKKGGKVDLLSGGFAFQDDDAPEAPAPEPPAPALAGLAQLPVEEQDAWLAPFRAALRGVKDIEDPALQGLVFVKTLGTMGRAFYTPANLGHFGLGSVCYCHFTSPIRRYPDLVVHRQLRWLLRGRQGPMPHDNASLEILAAHSSDQGAAAEGLERGVVDSAMVFASRAERWAGAQRALVNGITRGGAFMSMEGGLEARVATADIPGGPYSVDEFDSMLFVSSVERAEMTEDVTAKNWREMIDAQTEEVRMVRVRLGDRTTIVISGRDYAEGRVAAKLVE